MAEGTDTPQGGNPPDDSGRRSRRQGRQQTRPPADSSKDADATDSAPAAPAQELHPEEASTTTDGPLSTAPVPPESLAQPVPVTQPIATTTAPGIAAKPAVPVRAVAVSANGGFNSKGAQRMPQYLHPGVYVEEKPSDIKPIVGVGTSTCGFVGIVPPTVTILEPNPNYVPNGTEPPYIETMFPPALPPAGAAGALPAGPAPAAGAVVGEGEGGAAAGAGGAGAGPGGAVALSIPALKTALATANTLVATRTGELKTALAGVRPGVPATQSAADKARAAYRDAKNAVAQTHDALSQAQTAQDIHDAVAKPRVPVLCTSFSDFKKHFGGFSIDLDWAARDPERIASDRPPGHSDLAQGVYAFFNNGGTRCYVMGFPDVTALQDPESLEPFEGVDEIALVAAPGIHDPVIQGNVVAHCTRMGDRFAILDSAPTVPGDILTKENIQDHELKDSDYSALYFPWIKVFDLASKLRDPDSDGQVYVGPSGHMAGLYAHVDSTRGVHKAPANEPILGALDVRYRISNAIQDGLNPQGINCIRDLNGAIRPWGARTLGGDMNEDFKYINVRRLFLYIRKSIDRGTQWVVFEPNDRALWAKIVRNVSAFLTQVWRDGALFGSSPAEAFFVKCDDETNPPDLRELGRVTTEIGVSVVKPAEFVIFRISQWAGPKGS